jgi:hypothetical protein
MVPLIFFSGASISISEYISRIEFPFVDKIKQDTTRKADRIDINYSIRRSRFFGRNPSSNQWSTHQRMECLDSWRLTNIDAAPFGASTSPSLSCSRKLCSHIRPQIIRPSSLLLRSCANIQLYAQESALGPPSQKPIGAHAIIMHALTKVQYFYVQHDGHPTCN